jgi:hypothetical protein
LTVTIPHGKKTCGTSNMVRAAEEVPLAATRHKDKMASHFAPLPISVIFSSFIRTMLRQPNPGSKRNLVAPRMLDCPSDMLAEANEIAAISASALGLPVTLSSWSR